MFIVIDESGNEGFPTSKGQSKWFCLAAVVFQRESREAIENAFEKLHLRHGPKEFHFRKDSNARKLAALEEFSKLDFGFHIIACDKTALQRGRLFR